MSQHADIDRATVKHIAHLARLKLTDDEIETFGRQLGDVLGYFRKLQALDTKDVEPTAHPLPVRNVFRDDEPADSLGADRVLENAPDAEPPFFKVPKVLDQDTA